MANSFVARSFELPRKMLLIAAVLVAHAAHLAAICWNLSLPVFAGPAEGEDVKAER